MEEYITEWASAYPEDVFRPFTAEDTDVSRDRVGAAMARHIFKVMLRDNRARRDGEGERTAKTHNGVPISDEDDRRISADGP